MLKCGVREMKRQLVFQQLARAVLRQIRVFGGQQTSEPHVSQQTCRGLDRELDGEVVCRLQTKSFDTLRVVATGSDAHGQRHVLREFSHVEVA